MTNSKSQKFDNNHAYRGYKNSKKAGKRNMGLWAQLCPAEKIQLLEEEAVEYTDETHESRWGHHPCDYDTYLKLKELHRYWWKAVQREYEWERWNRKDPQNRVIRHKVRDCDGNVTGYNVEPRPEPVRSDLFYKTLKVKTWNGEREVRSLEYAEIVTDYRKARTPVADPNQVPKLSLSIEEIDRLLDAARLDKQAA
tara:strand:- start:6750 stop:7337 length:588 start_codon:yes stop_codon:yes gene_type:complete